MQTDRRNVGMVQSSDAVFTSVILLKGRLESEMSYVLIVKKGFEISRVMVDLLKRIANMPTERHDIDGPSESDTLLKQLFIAHLCTLHDP